MWYDELPGFLLEFNPARVLRCEVQIDSGSQALTCVCAPMKQPWIYHQHLRQHLSALSSQTSQSACLLQSWSTWAPRLFYLRFAPTHGSVFTIVKIQGIFHIAILTFRHVILNLIGLSTHQLCRVHK